MEINLEHPAVELRHWSPKVGKLPYEWIARSRKRNIQAHHIVLLVELNDTLKLTLEASGITRVALDLDGSLGSPAGSFLVNHGANQSQTASQVEIIEFSWHIVGAPVFEWHGFEGLIDCVLFFGGCNGGEVGSVVPEEAAFAKVFERLKFRFGILVGRGKIRVVPGWKRDGFQRSWGSDGAVGIDVQIAFKALNYGDAEGFVTDLQRGVDDGKERPIRKIESDTAYLGNVIGFVFLVFLRSSIFVAGFVFVRVRGKKALDRDQDRLEALG